MGRGIIRGDELRLEITLTSIMERSPMKDGLVLKNALEEEPEHRGETRDGEGTTSSLGTLGPILVD
jgi:hypothetical protein